MEKKLVEGARALDVGVGSGYLTACMAIMVCVDYKIKTFSA